MLALAGREQGDHGRKRDPMGPWTLAERGGNTFERLSVLFSCFLSFSFPALTVSALCLGCGRDPAAARLGSATAGLDTLATLEWTLAHERHRRARDGEPE